MLAIFVRAILDLKTCTPRCMRMNESRTYPGLAHQGMRTGSRGSLGNHCARRFEKTTGSVSKEVLLVQAPPCVSCSSSAWPVYDRHEPEIYPKVPASSRLVSKVYSVPGKHRSGSNLSHRLFCNQCRLPQHSVLSNCLPSRHPLSFHRQSASGLQRDANRQVSAAVALCQAGGNRSPRSGSRRASVVACADC